MGKGVAQTAEKATAVILGRQQCGVWYGDLRKVPGLWLEGAGLREWLGGMTGPPGVDGGGDVQEGLQDGVGEAHRSAASKVVAGRRKWSLMEGGEIGERKGVKLPSTPHPHPQGPTNFSQASPHAEATEYWPYLRAT